MTQEGKLLGHRLSTRNPGGRPAPLLQVLKKGGRGSRLEADSARRCITAAGRLGQCLLQGRATRAGTLPRRRARKPAVSPQECSLPGRAQVTRSRVPPAPASTPKHSLPRPTPSEARPTGLLEPKPLPPRGVGPAPAPESLLPRPVLAFPGLVGGRRGRTGHRPWGPREPVPCVRPARRLRAPLCLACPTENLAAIARPRCWVPSPLMKRLYKHRLFKLNRLSRFYKERVGLLEAAISCHGPEHWAGTPHKVSVPNHPERPQLPRWETAPSEPEPSPCRARRQWCSGTYPSHPAAAAKPGPCPRPTGCSPRPLAGHRGRSSASDSGNPSVTLTPVGRAVATKVRLCPPPKPSLQIPNELALAAGACRRGDPAPSTHEVHVDVVTCRRATCTGWSRAPEDATPRDAGEGLCPKTAPVVRMSLVTTLHVTGRLQSAPGKVRLQGVFGKLLKAELGVFEKEALGGCGLALPSVLPQTLAPVHGPTLCACSFEATRRRPHFPRACKSPSAGRPHTAATASCLLPPTPSHPCVRRTQLRPVGGHRGRICPGLA